MMAEKEYIEREAAINAVYEAYADGESALDALIALPAADVRPVVRGKWTLGHLPSTSGGSYAVVQCSECNSQFPIWRTNFCPNCGADMREVDDAR